MSSNLTVEELTARLEAAEQVCILFSWTGYGQPASPREDATVQAWSDWFDLREEQGVPLPKSADWGERIAKLAAKREQIRSATLASIRGVA